MCVYTTNFSRFLFDDDEYSFSSPSSLDDDVKRFTIVRFLLLQSKTNNIYFPNGSAYYLLLLFLVGCHRG